uniref:Putative secreted protein n=1 Tax=Panstrongylus lignarius TaxID=156445 RepID=A0A224XNI8_9HEMI
MYLLLLAVTVPEGVTISARSLVSLMSISTSVNLAPEPVLDKLVSLALEPVLERLMFNDLSISSNKLSPPNEDSDLRPDNSSSGLLCISALTVTESEDIVPGTSCIESSPERKLLELTLSLFKSSGFPVTSGRPRISAKR